MDGWIVAFIHPSINFTQGKLKPWWFCEFAYHIASHQGAHSHSGRLPRPATESQLGSTCFARRVAYKVTIKRRRAVDYMIELKALFVLRTYVVPPYVSGSCAAMRNTSINLRSNVQKCTKLSKHPPASGQRFRRVGRRCPTKNPRRENPFLNPRTAILLRRCHAPRTPCDHAPFTTP